MTRFFFEKDSSLLEEISPSSRKREKLLSSLKSKFSHDRKLIEKIEFLKPSKALVFSDRYLILASKSKKPFVFVYDLEEEKALLKENLKGFFAVFVSDQTKELTIITTLLKKKFQFSTVLSSRSHERFSFSEESAENHFLYDVNLFSSIERVLDEKTSSFKDKKNYSYVLYEDLEVYSSIEDLKEALDSPYKGFSILDQFSQAVFLEKEKKIFKFLEKEKDFSEKRIFRFRDLEIFFDAEKDEFSFFLKGQLISKSKRPLKLISLDEGSKAVSIRDSESEKAFSLSQKETKYVSVKRKSKKPEKILFEDFLISIRETKEAFVVEKVDFQSSKREKVFDFEKSEYEIEEMFFAFKKRLFLLKKKFNNENLFLILEPSKAYLIENLKDFRSVFSKEEIRSLNREFGLDLIIIEPIEPEEYKSLLMYFQNKTFLLSEKKIFLVEERKFDPLQQANLVLKEKIMLDQRYFDRNYSRSKLEDFGYGQDFIFCFENSDQLIELIFEFSASKDTISLKKIKVYSVSNGLRNFFFEDRIKAFLLKSKIELSKDLDFSKIKKDLHELYEKILFFSIKDEKRKKKRSNSLMI